MTHHRTVLPNGLCVITVPMSSFESATVLVMVKAGSRYETKQNNGISHFLEHMAFKGTKNRPTAIEISSIIDGIGGEMNAFTGKETTGYYIKSSANHINLSMDVLSDMLKNSLLDASEIEKEKGVISEELNLYEDTPTRRVVDLFERLLYGDISMGWDIGGEKEIIKKLQREDFLKYLSSLYSSHNITVVVAGGVEVDKAQQMANKYFSSMTKHKIISYPKLKESQKGPEVKIKHKKTEQAHIALGVRTTAIDHVDRYPLSVLGALLGGGMSSRLFAEVREKRGLAYYVRTVSDHYQDCGSLVSFAGVDPKRIDDAIAVILDQYHGISNFQFPISNDELAKAKEYLKGHFVLDLEDSRSVAGFYSSQELLEKEIDNPEDVIAKIDKVTICDVAKVAAKYLEAQRLNLAVVGNFEDETRFEKLLSV